MKFIRSPRGPIFFLFLLCLILPGTATSFAHNLPLSSTDMFCFGDIGFGDPPTQDMLCVGGPCDETTSSTAAKINDSILLSYQRSVDRTHLGSVAITTPRYDFHDNRLIRIQFNLICPPENLQSCAERLTHKLDDHYGLTLLQSPKTESSLPTGLYQSDSGEVVSFFASKIEEDTPMLSVRFYNKPIMDEVRTEANPAYIASPLPAPYASY